MKNTVQPKAPRDSQGRHPYQFVCRHMMEETGLKYHAIKWSPSHPFMQAWCEKCHAVLREEGGWTDRAKQFADLQGICADCYEKVVRRHKETPLRG
jgi:hypothetical protein